jgi:hypothetical protein
MCLIAASLLSVAALSLGCSGGDSEPDSDGPESSETSSSETSPVATIESACAVLVELTKDGPLIIADAIMLSKAEATEELVSSARKSLQPVLYDGPVELRKPTKVVDETMAYVGTRVGLGEPTSGADFPAFDRAIEEINYRCGSELPTTGVG